MNKLKIEAELTIFVENKKVWPVRFEFVAQVLLSEALAE